MSLSSHDENPPADVPQTKERQDAGEQYPSTHKQIIITIALCLASFLVNLDQNIISTAIPRISDEFHSLDDIAWYGSSYLLTMCSFSLVMGRVYKYYPAKPVFLAGITIFEIGSAVCGSAPNSKAFIVGRAVSGLGSSGMLSGMMVIMFHTIPLQSRPIYMGIFGAVFAVASVVGPVLGGVFTDKVTWRLCFYINLPIGAVTIIAIIFILHLPNQKLDSAASGWVGKMKQLDPLGNLVFFPGMICLILALQWGGTGYSWKDARVIVLLVLCGAFCLAFAGIQVWKKETGTVPPRIVKQRSVAACIWFSFFHGGGMIVLMYYLPIWFQAIKGATAVKSGIMLLPLILSTVVTAILSGIIVSKLGYYNPFFILAPITMAIGAGLLSTLTPSTGHAKWIGYQVLFGIGLGCGAQQPMIAVQSVLERSDISTGTAIVMFARFLGPAIFLPVAQNIFLRRLISKLSNLPGISPNAVTGGGATDLKNLASGDDLVSLISDYNTAIVDVIYLAVATSALTILSSFLLEWKNLKVLAAEQGGASKDKVKKSVKSEEPV